MHMMTQPLSLHAMQDTVALNGTARHIVDRWTSGAVLGQLRRVLKVSAAAGGGVAAAAAGGVVVGAAAGGSAVEAAGPAASLSGPLGANSGERPLSCNIAQTGEGVRMLSRSPRGSCSGRCHATGIGGSHTAQIGEGAGGFPDRLEGVM